MAPFVQLVLVSLRSHARNPGFFITAVLTLALGIGGNTAIFSVVNNIFYRQLPFADADHLVRLHMASPTTTGGLGRVNILGAYFDNISDESHSAKFVAMRDDNAALIGSGEPQRVSVVHISSGWTDVFGVQPALGRYFTEDEQNKGGASRVAIISDALWRERFSGNAQVLARSLTLENENYSIVGVFPPGFRFPYQADIWLPTVVPPGQFTYDYAVFARLNPGTTIAQFRLEMASISEHMRKQYTGFANGQRIEVTPGRESLVSGQDEIAKALFCVVAFLLLIACVDVSSLLLARSVMRSRELALRTALGATQWHHLKMAFAESLSLTLAGCGLGFVLTKLFSGYLTVLVPMNLREELTLSGIRLDYRVWTYAIGLTLLIALACAAAPLLNPASANLNQSLKEGARATAPGGRRRILEAFVVGQIALALVLLTGAGLMIENFRRLSHRPLGVEADKTLTLVCSLPRTRYLSGEERISLVRDLTESLRAVPGVSAVGISTVNPIYLYTGTWSTRVGKEGWEAKDGIVINHRLITPGLFEALGIPLRGGRVFSDQDSASSEPVAIVSQALARRLWPEEDPIGKRIQESSRRARQWRRVVGVVADVEDAGDYRETWYVPYAQAPTAPSSEELHIMVRSEGDAGALAHAAAHAVWKVDSALPLRNISRLDNLYSGTLTQERTGAVAGMLFSTFGLLLASVGAFGVMSFAASRRTHEIGVRLTLGASPNDVLKMVLSWGGRLAAIGTLAGLVGVLVLNRFLIRTLPLVQSTEPAVYGMAAAMVGLATLVACWVPARRASSVDPILALRCE